ncbi:MAG: hypothetical protein CM15mP21_3640 [Hyphomicrobiales bacterium]|nr:MAG: hypothetical protein CM15mP21_3640 [Hyphomicrobiales bacterium]
MALRVRGETVEEITAGAKVMRRHALAVKAPDHALDTCGTAATAPAPTIFPPPRRWSLRRVAYM